MRWKGHSKTLAKHGQSDTENPSGRVAAAVHSLRLTSALVTPPAGQAARQAAVEEDALAGEARAGADATRR